MLVVGQIHTPRNLLCLLPDGFIGVTYWARHPCDDALYMHEAWIWGPRGRVGYWMDARS